MPPRWSDISKALNDLYATRVRLREFDGSNLTSRYDNILETVYSYPPQRNPWKSADMILAEILRDVDSLLRQEGRSGEIEWLETSLGEFTGLPLCRVGELSLERFCPDPDPAEMSVDAAITQRAGFDKFVMAIVDRLAVWTAGPSSQPTPPPVPTQEHHESVSRILSALERLGTRSIGKVILSEAGLPDTPHFRGILGNLPMLNNVRGANGGYWFKSGTASDLPPDKAGHDQTSPDITGHRP